MGICLTSVKSWYAKSPAEGHQNQQLAARAPQDCSALLKVGTGFEANSEKNISSL